MTSSDQFPVPVRSAVKSNLTIWCCQNLSKRALNALTVQAPTTKLGKLFQMFTMRAEKNGPTALSGPLKYMVDNNSTQSILLSHAHSKCLTLTYTTEQFDAERSEYKEQQEEEKTEVADFRQRLHHCVQQCTNRFRHLQQLQHFTTDTD